MKKAAWILAACCASAIGFVVLGAKKTRIVNTSSPSKPVDQLAHKLEEAWADYYTIV